MIARCSRLALLAFVAVVCVAAATAQSSQWLDVPFVSQPENGCGAAVISMTAQYWNAHGANVPAGALDVDSIQRELYSPPDHGIRASDMVSYFDRIGFRAFTFRGDIAELADHIAKGRPLVVALRESRDIRHYVVVVGTEIREHAVLLNDPARRKLLKMDLAEFQKAWAGANHWTLLVVPKA
jgi:ABC-type bacteriocin/lantibiotic exporter with double-glycine peptidase domain